MCDSFGLRLFEIAVFLNLSLFWINQQRHHYNNANLATTNTTTFTTFPTTIFATSRPTNTVLHGPRGNDLRGTGEGRRIAALEVLAGA